MAKYRDSEFVAFACKGTNVHINKNLLMRGNEVFSYALKIAEVDRAAKVARVNIDALGRSMTTTRHVRSALMDLEKLPSDWTVASVNGF